MSLSRVIEVSFNGGSIAYAKVDTAYFYNNGILFKPADLDLPASYQVHWADSPQASSTLETIGTAEGAPIPDDLWNRSRVIYGWIYLHPTEDSAVTYKEVRIYKNARAGMPDGTEPTPSEQSTIDQLISALNSAVEQTGEDVESAEQAKDDAESARDNAQTYANNAQESAQASASSAESASQSAQTASEKATASAQIKADVEDLVDDTQSYAESALIASQASVTARDTAQGYAQSASVSAQSASTSASNASTSAQTASTMATEASTSAQTASTKATEASQSASQALSYKTDAESAKTASQAAQGLAESARDTAVSAKNDAQQIKTDVQNIADGIDTRLTDVEDALAEKAPVITDTASGAIASFSDGADNLPLKSLVVDINPIQDLHGQDAPYPAGGGKNKFDPNSANHNWVGTNGVITQRDAGKTVILPISSGSSVTLSNANASSATNILLLAFFDSNDTLLSRHPLSTGATYITATAPENTAYVMASFFTWSEASYAQLELGSTATSWSPYENICPISGWTEVGVEQRGINVWDEEWELGSINFTTGIKQNSSANIRSKNYIPVIGGATYYGKAGTLSSSACVVFFYTKDKTYISNAYCGNTAFTVPSNAKYALFYCGSAYGTTYNHDISINYPSTDHDYHPYTGRSINIQLGQTVYGGHIDVLSGVLTVDRAMVTFDGTESGWQWYDAYKQAYISDALSNAPAKYNVSELTYICNVLNPVVNQSRPSNIGNFASLISSGASAAFSAPSNTLDEFKAFVQANPIQFCYELAELIEIQLTPNQVNSLLGVNNLWADSGDTEVVYRADTKLFIERLTAPDSADMIADANITSGKYFMVGNSLYKATANIANGSAIIVGTNAVRKSLSEALNEINA